MSGAYDFFVKEMEKLEPKMGSGEAGRILGLRFEERKKHKSRDPGEYLVTFETDGTESINILSCYFCLPVIDKVAPGSVKPEDNRSLSKGTVIVHPRSYKRLVEIAEQPCVKRLEKLAWFDGYDDVEKKFLYATDLGAAIGGMKDEKNGKNPEPMNDWYLVVEGQFDSARAEELEKYSAIMAKNEGWKAIEQVGIRKENDGQTLHRVRPKSNRDLLEMAKTLSFVKLICEDESRRFSMTPRD